MAVYFEKNGRKLRCGYTTGSCAAAASKAALMMILFSEDIHNVSIMTPKGILYTAEILDISHNEDGSVSCAVIKDGGDDPDITSGAKIYAKVALRDEKGILIEGGEGVGRVTKPGLDQPVGEAAINSVPRKMIRENLEEVLEKCGLSQKGAVVVISVPEGKKLSEKTFNPKLGIVGGISILGTTGIVEPMSDKAILDTIQTEINVRHAEGRDTLLVAPGNYGLTFLKEKYNIDTDIAVMSSNFIYDTVQMAADAGFSGLLLAGHIGKLIKVAGGIRNTHSMYGDHRMEILSEICTDHAELLDESSLKELTDQISECVMTDEAVRIIREYGIAEPVFMDMAERIKGYLEEWGENRFKAEVIVFSNENTELVRTKGAEAMIDLF